MVPRFVVAQTGIAIGSAAAGFGTGVVVARDADAPFWNPALLGIQPYGDVRSEPVGSLRVLSVSVPRAASRDWIATASRVGLLNGGPRAAPRWASFVAPGGGATTGGEANIIWISSATGTMALSISSHAEAGGSFAAESSDTVVRSASSVARLAVAGPAGEVFGIRARAGLTLKGRWVHVHGWGSATEGGGYREIMVRDVPAAAADVGVVLQPGSFVVSGVLSDIVSFTARPDEGARIRSVMRSASGENQESESPAVDEASSDPDRRAAEIVYGDAVPSPVARLGVAHVGSWGEMAVAVEHRVRSASRDDPSSGWSASYRVPSDRFPVRLGVTRGPETSGWELGWVATSCRIPWSASFGRVRAAGEGDATMSFSLSLGWRSAPTCGVGR